MASDRTYLEFHGKQWRVQVKVPPAARAALGKNKLVHPLRTDSLAAANRLKHIHVIKFKAMIDAASYPAKSGMEELAAEATRWREIMRRGQSHQPSKTAPSIYNEPPLEAEEVIALERAGLVDPPTYQDLLALRAHDVEKRHGSSEPTRASMTIELFDPPWKAGYFWRQLWQGFSGQAIPDEGLPTTAFAALCAGRPTRPF